MLAPTRSSAEVEKLLGSDFEGLLTSDCYSAYLRQSAYAKQKCLAHLETELESRLMQISLIASILFRQVLCRC